MSHIKHKSGLTELQRRTCAKPGCYKYFPTLKALKFHTRICSTIFDINDDDTDDDLDLVTGLDFE